MSMAPLERSTADDNTQNQMADELTVVEFARDAKIHIRLFPESRLQAHLRGRVTRNDRRGGIAFLTLIDVTETIQLVAERAVLGQDAWDEVRRLTRGSGVAARGRVGTTSSGIVSVFLSSAPEALPTITSESLLADHFHEVGRQILLARLTSAARQSFYRRNFTELEARLLSTKWPEASLQPLRVSYSGFGPLHFYLAVSPLRQLANALIATGQHRVFSITRCFTSSYLDHISGVESVILSALLLDADIRAGAELASQVIFEVISEMSTRPPVPTLSSDFQVRDNLNWPPASEMTIEVPEMQIYPTTAEAEQPSFFRICWPPDYLLGEGHSYQLSDEAELSCTAVNVNLERAVSLLHSGDLRRVLNRG